MEAAKNGNVDTINALIEAKADVNADMNGGWRVLMEAVNYGNADAARALIKAGAN